MYVDDWVALDGLLTADLLLHMNSQKADVKHDIKHAAGLYWPTITYWKDSSNSGARKDAV